MSNINPFSDTSSVWTYTEEGQVDYLAKLDDCDEAYSVVEQEARTILSENLSGSDSQNRFQSGWLQADIGPGS